MIVTQKTKKYGIMAAGMLVAAVFIISPFDHLSAEAPIKIDEKAKVHKVIVADINREEGTILAQIEEATIIAYLSASTTVFLGNGEETNLGEISGGEGVYLFGLYSTSTQTLSVDKIVIRNKSPFSRKSLSRSESDSSTIFTFAKN